MVDIKDKLANSKPAGSAHLAGELPASQQSVVVQVCQMTGWDDEDDIARKTREEHRIRNLEESRGE